MIISLWGAFVRGIMSKGLLSCDHGHGSSCKSNYYATMVITALVNVM